MKRLTAFAALTTSAAVLFVSGGTSVAQAQASGQKVQLTFAWWGDPQRNTDTMNAIKLFEKKYPNITVNTWYSPWNGYWDKIATETSGGNAPDIYQMDISYLEDYATQGSLLPINRKVVNVSNISPALLSTGRVNGKLYAIPNSENAFVLLYNPQLLSKAGVKVPASQRWTWSQFIDVLKKVQQTLPAGSYATEDPSIDGDTFTYYIKQHKGQNLFNKTGTALGFPEKTMVDFLQLGVQLRNDHLAPPMSISQTITDQSNSLVTMGKAAFTMTWDNAYDGYVTDSNNKSLRMMLLPSMPGGTEGSFLDPSQFWAISSKTKYPKQAEQLVDFLLNDTGAGLALSDERGVPPSLEVRAAIQKEMPATDQVIFQTENLVAKHSRPMDLAYPPATPQIFNLFTTAYQEVGYGKETPAQATAAFFASANKLLKK